MKKERDRAGGGGGRVRGFMLASGDKVVAVVPSQS